MKEISKTTKWLVSILLIVIGLLAGAIKFGFMYDRGLGERFVEKEGYNLQVKTLKEDIGDIKKKQNKMAVQQQEDSRKLDRALVILEEGR